MEYKKVNLKDFGGRFDDPTFDNAAAILRGVDYLLKDGGGTLDMSCHMVAVYSPINIDGKNIVTIIFPKYIVTKENFKFPKKVPLLHEFQIAEIFKKGPQAHKYSMNF